MSKLLPFKHPGTYVRDLGSGAAGKVCEIEYHGRLCALKYSPDRSTLEEANVLKVIGPHPHIVKVLESGIDEKAGQDPISWMVMEKFDETAESGLSSGRVRSAHVKRMFRQVFEALAHVQKQGFTHEDCHLENIGVKWDKDGQPTFFLCDFGRAYCHSESFGADLSVGSDANFFFIHALPRIPFTDNPGQVEQNKRNRLFAEAVRTFRPRILAYMLGIGTVDELFLLLDTALTENKVPSLQFILAFLARGMKRTLASQCREMLGWETNPLYIQYAASYAPVVAMCRWAGYLDNPDIKGVISKANSQLIRAKPKDWPSELNRLLSM